MDYEIRHINRIYNKSLCEKYFETSSQKQNRKNNIKFRVQKSRKNNKQPKMKQKKIKLRSKKVDISKPQFQKLTKAEILEQAKKFWDFSKD